MQKEHNTIRVKVIGWFLLAALAVLLTGVISYTSYRDLLALTSTGSQETKLTVLGGILANITEAEAKMRAYGLTREPELLDSYQQLVISIEKELTQVKTIEPVDEVFNHRVDSISHLLNQQTLGISGFVELKKSLDQLSFSTKALREINTTADSVPSLTTTTTTTTTTTRIDPRLEEQKNHLEEQENDKKNKNTKRQQRKRAQERAQEIVRVLAELEGKPQIQTETTTKTDTSFIQPDSLLENIQQILVDIGLEEDRYQQMVSQRELQIIESSIVIIDQIRGLISSLEKQELAYNIERANNAKLIASRSTLTISIIIFICLILGILFTYWIFRDVRISDFYNRQLIGAKQQAEKLADSKQQFLANMSHEIRTPLNAIIGFTEQLADTGLQPKQRDYLDAVQTSSHHLLNTVNDILDYSKIEAGELKISKEPFELSSVLKEVVNTLQIKAKEKGLELSLDLTPDKTFKVLGDPFRLKQILFNLVSNGIKFTEKGFVKVQCNCSELDGQIHMQVAVADSGIGIPRDQWDNIFSDFKQVDPSSTRRYQGTGLGLAICKRLVELQDGTIRVASNKPQGTVFTVELKYQISKGNSIEPAGADRNTGDSNSNLENKSVHVVHAMPEGPNTAASPVGHSNLRILVADDDVFNRQLIETILAKGSFDVIFCSDGRQALEKMKKHQFDLVLTDINMPEMNGVELSREIRSFTDAKRKAVPIIALTANVMENDLEKYRQAGIDDFLLKPFKQSALFGIINNYTDYHKTTGANHSEETNSSVRFQLDDFKKFSVGDDDALRPLLEAFYQNLNENLQQMEKQAENQDHQAVAELAHKMISSFGHVHAMEPVQKLRLLESQIRSNQSELPIRRLVSEVHELATPVMEGLKKELEALS